MTDVTIRRCVMRVVRRGGWSWGPAPRQFVANAVRALPALLAAELERLLPEEADGEVSAPLRLDVRVGLADLRQWALSATREDAPPPDAAQAHLAAATPPPVADGIAEALRRALVTARVAERVTTTLPPVKKREAVRPLADAQARVAALLNLLIAWRAAGRLEPMLRALPERSIAAWHRALLKSPAATAPADAPVDASRAAIDAALAHIARRARNIPAQDRPIVRLLAAVELAAAAAVSPTTATARAAIDAAIALEPADRQAPQAEIRRAGASNGRRAASGTEVRVSSALPFLLLGPLSRIGWLDVVDATFAAAELEDSLPALALALAAKVLPEPERGWRRQPATVTAAAAFAGDAEPRPDAEVADLARVAAPLAPALETLIRRSLLDGRRAGDPLLLCSAGAIRLLVEPAGVFLIAQATTPDAFVTHAQEAEAPLFVPAEEADARMLAMLDAAGVTFVTPAPPVRGEHWKPVPGTRSPRLFTNRRAPALTPPSEEVTARARATWQELERRPLPGRPEDPAFERAMAMAAAVALGTIAWELWRERETTDPLLTIERFGDLEGTVQFEEHRVRVRVPLGKRFRDLQNAGLVEDVPRVPWLGFRPVVFAGG